MLCRRTSLSWLFRLLPCCFLALAMNASGQTGLVTVEDGKATLLHAILNHTTWPDDEDIDQFIVGLYGYDPALLQTLNKALQEVTIRGKSVDVRSYRTIPEAKESHILVLTRATNYQLEKIDRELHLSQTLIVTDRSDDQRRIMINFTQPSETLLSFEINRSNIVYAGLELSKDILLFGGTELDVATIYKETEAELVRAKEVARDQELQLEVQQRLLADQQRTIAEQRAQVEANRAELATLEQDLTAIRTTLDNSASKLAANEAALLEKEQVLAEKEAYIQSYSGKIERNLARLEDQAAEIDEKELLINEQNRVLVTQVNTIQYQKYFLVAAAAVLVLVLSLIGIIFRSYRSKHRINLKLEGKTKELEVANYQLVQVTDAKSRFLSTMSHEIRTPMNGVIGMAELLQGTQLSAQQRDYLSLIITSADTLLDLINDILDFSKIEAGRLDLESIPFKLRDILGDTLQSMALQASEKGLELSFHIPPEVPDQLIGDPVRLRQIVVNLVGNAIKFTESGEIVVDLSLETVSAQSARIAFEVRDTGLGISEHQQRKIFEAFGQADSSTTRQFGGTGLGLAIASQLVEIMGGNMALDSRPGQGSRFSFGADFQLADEPDTEPLHPDSLRGLRVLVVDDNSTNRMILEELLNNWGMVVRLAEGGEQALAELDGIDDAEQPYVLALLDVMMPHMDGFELAARMREHPQGASMRILMLTSAGSANQEAQRDALDISRVLLKPVKHSDLLVSITDALGVTRAEDSTAIPEEHPADLAVREVLLVEDNPVNQKVANDLLTRRGHQVEVVNNGAQALDYVFKKAFDVVLMDVHMPVMDGLTATRAIREQEQASGSHVPIIAMTAGATTEDREQCFAAGMDAFVTKPFRAGELYRVVEEAAPGREREATEEPTEEPVEDKPGEARLDWQAALRNLDGDEELLIELSEMFLTQCPELLAEIEKAISSEQAAELQRAAHTLKGSAHIIGAQAVAAAALRLEEIGREEKPETAAPSLRSLESELAELEPALLLAMGQRPAAN